MKFCNKHTRHTSIQNIVCLCCMCVCVYDTYAHPNPHTTFKTKQKIQSIILPRKRNKN